MTGYRNKNATGSQSGFKAKFDKGGEVESSSGNEFVNINAAAEGSDEYGTEPNTCTFDVPETAIGSTTITMTRSHTSTNLYVTKLEITTTTSGGEEPASSYPITAKWDFQNLIPATLADVNIQGTIGEDVASNVDGIVMHVISAGGKLQYNTSGYAQFNTNTTIQVPVLTTTDIVTVVSYPGQSHYNVGGENAEGQNTYNHTATAAEVKQGYVEIIPTATAYIYSIQVVQNEPAGSGDEPEEEVGGSVTWAIGNETEATISSGISDAILTTGVTVGSGLTASSKTYLETSMIAYQPTTSNPGIVESAMIEYRVKVYSGIKFNPTSVSYNAVKDGTDNATYKWSYTIDGAESDITEVSKDDIVRNNNTSGTPAMQHTHNLTASKCDEFTFRIYVSGFANTKKLGIGNVVISGTVSGSKAPLETYTVTFANNDADAQGTAPSAVNVTQYESTTMPVNKTLYKDGYTLTGWTDGTTTYNIGTDFTPTANTTLNPVFTQNSVSLSETLKPVVIKWDFQTGQGAPTFELQGNSGILVTQATVNKSTIDVKLGIDATSGKFNNASWTDWCQVNEGTTFTLPSKNGAVVEAYSMSEPKNGSDVKSTLDDNEYASYTSSVATYSTTNESGSSVLVIKGGSYYRYIQLTYPGSGAAWANFESFEMDLRNGAYITSKETSNTTIGFKKDGDNIVRSEADDDANIGTITAKFHSDDHGLQNFSMMVAVPGYVKVSAGTCAWGGNLSINGSNGFSYIVNTNTGACYHQNTTANKVYAYYTSNEGTTLTIAGGSYMPYIAVESVDFYTLTGTINGGNIDGKDVILTSELTGQSFTATVTGSAFTVKVPADKYVITLSNNEDFVISDPTSVAVSADAPLTINVVSATPQMVYGAITNAPAEAFTLTFTGANYAESVECAANATSFTKNLMPDTYVISSSVGTLSPLSVESFKVLKDAVSHNIYFPEEAVPAATQQNITVDNTAAVAANVYNTVTDALAAAKAGNISNPVITLTSGQTYQEQVIVDQAGVTLKTSGAEKATITFYYGIGYTYYSLNEKGYYDKDRAMTRNSILMKDPSRWGTTVLVTNKGNNFKAENIIFENSFNQRYTAEEVTDGVRPNGCQGITYDRTLTSEQGGFQAADAKAVTERAAALAFENNPTGCQLYDCILIGSQDTYYTSGIIYNKNCDIVGNTDYIFGGGTVVFDNCNLVIGGYSDKETSAYITAQKGSAGDHYIFRDCTVKKGDRIYTLANLGRDWGGPDATVYYFNLKNEMGNKLEYKWTNMGGGISAGTANLHIYDFDPAINANYNTTGANGANVNGVLADDVALSLYAEVVASMGFTPERIYEDKVELSESSAYNVCRIAASDNVERDVTLTRTLAAGQWTAIVLPFSMTSEQNADAFGAGAKVAELSSTTNTALYFTTVDAMEANQPYIIQVSDDFTAVNINGVTITKADPTVVFGGWTATGTYAAGKIPAGSHYISNNMVKKAADDTNDITAMSVYFTNTFADAVELYVDGISTCIKNVKPGQPAGDIVYTLQGVRVEKAQKGLYIINGRKAIVK